MTKLKNKLPKGWNLARVKRVADHYDSVSDEQLAMEDDAAWADKSMAIMLIPRAMVPKVRKLLETKAKRVG